MHHDELGLELGNEQRLRHEVAQTIRTNARGERLRGQRFRVIVALLDLAQGQPTWSGSLGTLGAAAGVSGRTAGAAIADAQALSFVLVERRAGRSSIYTPNVAAIMDHHTQLASQESRIPGSSPRAARRRTADPRQQMFPWPETSEAGIGSPRKVSEVPTNVAGVTPESSRVRSRILKDLGAELLPARKVARVIGLILEFIATFRRAESAESAETPETGVGSPRKVSEVPTKVAGVTPESCGGDPGKSDSMHDHEHESCIHNSSITMAPAGDKGQEQDKGSLGEERPEPGKTFGGGKRLGAGGKQLKRSDLGDPRELQRLWLINSDRMPAEIGRVEFFALAAALGPYLSTLGLQIRSPIGAFWALLGGQIIAGRDWRAIVQECQGARNQAADWIWKLDKATPPAATPGPERGQERGWPAGEEWVAEQRRRQSQRQQEPAGVN